MGIAPFDFTLKELDDMAYGRLSSEWDQMSSLMALVANMVRDSKKHRQPYRPYDFHPLAERGKSKSDEVIPITFGDLKKAFTKDNPVKPNPT